MLKFNSMRVLRLQATTFCLLVIWMFAATANASLTNDLQMLVSEGNTVNTQISPISLTVDNSCAELGTAIASVEAFNVLIENVSNSLAVPVSLTNDDLNALDELTVISMNISALLPAMSTDISAMTFSNDMADINAAMDAMLKLSDDIGTMADRILEMADKILLMADNIGAMADRILLTQQIQSANIAMTQSTILTTQQNIVLLASTVDTSVYNTALNSLITTGNTLSNEIAGIQLTESNMSTELASFESRVSDYQNSVALLVSIINADSSIASHYINSDTLNMLGDLSVINAALASSLNAYATAVNGLAPTTNISVLNDAVYSMLRLAGDIGEMANRIVEMGDDINIMADNIGLMALRIVETQTLQTANLELTQSNLSAAQITSIQIIAAFGL